MNKKCVLAKKSSAKTMDFFYFNTSWDPVSHFFRSMLSNFSIFNFNILFLV